MNFNVGDRVKDNSQLLTFSKPDWADQTWTIAALRWDERKGQDRLLAHIVTDDGLEHDRISTAMLVRKA